MLPIDLGYKIAVLQAGFVYVGDCFLYGTFSAGHLVIKDCKNIRVWGTKRGLGQLALEGATPNTVVDDVGELLVPAHALLHLTVCNKRFKSGAGGSK